MLISRKSYSLFNLGLLAAFSASAIPPLSARDREGSPRDLADTVLAGIQHNYSQFKTLRLTVERLIETPGLTKPLEKVSKRPDGQIKVTILPRSTTTYKYVFRDDHLRCDTTSLDDSTLDETWVFKGKTAIQYTRADKNAWLRPISDVPAHTLDPREYGVADHRKTLVDILREYVIRDARFRTDTSKEDLLRLATEDPRTKQRIVFDFSPSMNFLPVKVAYLNEDSSVRFVTVITYKELIPQSAWFPSKSVRKVFSAKRVTLDDDVPFPECQQVSTTTVKGDFVINEPVSDSEFEIDYSQDTRIIDTTGGRGRAHLSVIGESGPVSHRDFTRITLSALALLLACCVIAGFLWFRRTAK